LVFHIPFNGGAMPTKQSVFILLLILSVFLFAFGQGVLAQGAPPPVDGTPPADGAPPDDSIQCDLLLEEATDELTDAIEAEQIALFGTGTTGDLPFAGASDLFLFQAYSLLYGSIVNLDRTAETVFDMSVEGCTTPESSLEMIDDIHLARGKKGYLLANLEFVDAVVYAGLLKRAIVLEKKVLLTLIGPPVVPGDPTVPEVPTTPPVEPAAPEVPVVVVP
jgi:hypothetical protein